ncbi:DUF4868 domain-containing protein [Pseudomonas aeruginosa]|nr:DUF4868 domain-containing protein [Pseudomonas aeruginosa]HEJ6321616.1 DUF4868 domain-containing protein [Pseudomonas aeruginosa]
MTIDAIRDKVQRLKGSQHTTAVMYFILNAAGVFRLRKVSLTQDAQQEATRALIEDLEQFFNGDYVLRDLTNADQRDNAIYSYNLPRKPEQLDLLILSFQDQGQTPEFDHVNDSLADVKAIVLTVGDGQDKLSVYKHHFPTNTYRHSGFSILRVGMNQNRFKQLDEDIVRVGRSIDFLYDGADVYVTNFKILERFFGFKDVIKAEAEGKLNQLAERDIIENIEVLRERIVELGDTTFSKKVIRALVHSPVLDRVGNDRIIRFVRGHQILGKKIRVNDAGTQFNLDTKISQNFFIKLLNDDYLKSELTNFDYDADNKDIVEVENDNANA